MVEQLPYGPATRQIRRLFQRLAALSPEAEQSIVQAHAVHSRTAAYRSAEKRLSVLFPQSGRTSEWEASMRVLIQLTQRNVDDQLDLTAADGDASLSTMRAISEPATAALFALMILDLLTDAEFVALYEPFASVIPRSALQ